MTGIDAVMEIPPQLSQGDRAIPCFRWAKEQKTAVFGLHIGGEARRGKLSAPFIEGVAPRCDQLIVTEDGNKDGYFTTLAKEKQIPLTVVKDTQELGALLKKTFGAN